MRFSRRPVKEHRTSQNDGVDRLPPLYTEEEGILKIKTEERARGGERKKKKNK